MGRNCQLAIHDENNRELANYKVPYGTKILVEEDSKVSSGTKICEWDPFTNPVISEKSGTANYVDMEEGISLIEETEEKKISRNARCPLTGKKYKNCCGKLN